MLFCCTIDGITDDGFFLHFHPRSVRCIGFPFGGRAVGSNSIEISMEVFYERIFHFARTGMTLMTEIYFRPVNWRVGRENDQISHSFSDADECSFYYY